MANMNFWNNGLTPENRVESQQPTQVVCVFTADGMFANMSALGHDRRTSDGGDIDVDPYMVIDDSGLLVKRYPDYYGPKNDAVMIDGHVAGHTVDREGQLVNSDFMIITKEAFEPRVVMGSAFRDALNSTNRHPSLQVRPGVDPNSEDYFSQLGETRGD